MQTIRSLLVLTLLSLIVGLTACDTIEPLTPEFNPPEAAALDIQPESYVHNYWTTHGGLRQFRTIVGDGVNLRVEADYHPITLRLVTIRYYSHGELVAGNTPEWHGDERRGHMFAAPTGEWMYLGVTGPESHEVISYGPDGGYWPNQGPYGESFGGFDAMSGSCWPEYTLLASSLILHFGTSAALAATTVPSGGLSLVVGGAAAWTGSLLAVVGSAGLVARCRSGGSGGGRELPTYEPAGGV